MLRVIQNDGRIQICTGMCDSFMPFSGFVFSNN